MKFLRKYYLKTFCARITFCAKPFTASDGNRNWRLSINDNKTRFQVYNGTGLSSNAITSDGGSSISIGQKYLFGGRWNGTHIVAIINGSIDDSTPALADSIYYSATNRLAVGRGTVTEYWNGTIDNAVVYNYSLSEDQLLTTYIDNGNSLKRLTQIDYCQDTYRGLNWYSERDGVLLLGGFRLRNSTDCSSYSSAIYEFDSALATPYLLWQDSSNTTFASWKDNGTLYMSKGNLTNWTTSLEFSCQNGTAWSGKGITELSNGDLLVGQYLTGESSEKCAIIYKSEDGGSSWDVVYNNTNARHIHFVQADPYTGYIYASTGDGVGSRNLLRSIDNGTTWTAIKTDNTDGISWQPTSVVFTENYRIFGEDNTPTDSYSRIIRTSDDVNFDIVFNSSDRFEGAWYWGVKDNNGIIYFGMMEVDDGLNIPIVASEDNGTSWYYAKLYNSSYVGEQSLAQGGTYSPSNFDASNRFYLHGVGTENNMRISDLGDKRLLDYQFNENNGTIAYDSSGNNNHGTINGATWQNDGVLVSLVEGVDYTLNTATGLLTLSSDYLYEWVEVVWGYEYLENLEKNARDYGKDSITNIMIKLPLTATIFMFSLLLIIILGVVYHILNKSKSIQIG